MTATQGIHLEVPDEDYFALPRLSQTGIKTLLDSPARFRWEQDNPQAYESDAMAFGSVVHTLLLGTGASIRVLDAPDWRSSKVREQRDAIRAAGQVPLLQKDWQKAAECAEAVMANPEAAALLDSEGDSEVTVTWDRQVGDSIVPMKARIDRVSASPERTVLVDVKTTLSAAPHSFAASVFRYGYDLQRAAYLDGWLATTGLEAEFVFLAVEKEPPYLSTVYRLDWAGEARGLAGYEAGLARYVECVATDEWPGYPGGVLASPGWVKYEMREQGAQPEGESVVMDTAEAWQGESA